METQAGKECTVQHTLQINHNFWDKIRPKSTKSLHFSKKKFTKFITRSHIEFLEFTLQWLWCVSNILSLWRWSSFAENVARSALHERTNILHCVILRSITSGNGLVWIYWLWGPRLATFCFWVYFIYANLMEWITVKSVWMDYSRVTYFIIAICSWHYLCHSG